MKGTAKRRSTIILGGATIGATVGTLAMLRYALHQIRRRGYPSWEACHCDFKTKQAVFQVWYGRHKQQGETIVLREWGFYLVHPPVWLRRSLHHSSQIIAAFKPHGRYLERVTLDPQESYQLASILHARTTNEDLPEQPPEERTYVIWRQEILQFPHSPFGICLRRLYPAHLSPDKLAQAAAVPALWDPERNLPLPVEGPLLDLPSGTHIDRIGWSPAQISYCTARLHPEPSSV